MSAALLHGSAAEFNGYDGGATFHAPLRAVTLAGGHAVPAATVIRIIAEVRSISCVVYDVTSKPPGSIEWA